MGYLDTVAGAAREGGMSTAAIDAGALAASAAGRAIMADSFFDIATIDSKVATGAIGEDRLTAAELTGRAAAVVANANVIGGVPIIFRLDIADASADTDVVMTHKVRVLDAWALNTGIAAHAANDTWQVKNGANAISDAVAKGATVNAVKRIGSIDPARHDIAAAGTLRVSAVKDTNAAITLYVLAVRVT